MTRNLYQYRIIKISRRLAPRKDSFEFLSLYCLICDDFLLFRPVSYLSVKQLINPSVFFTFAYSTKHNKIQQSTKNGSDMEGSVSNNFTNYNYMKKSPVWENTILIKN